MGLDWLARGGTRPRPSRARRDLKHGWPSTGASMGLPPAGILLGVVRAVPSAHLRRGMRHPATRKRPPLNLDPLWISSVHSLQCTVPTCWEGARRPATVTRSAARSGRQQQQPRVGGPLCEPLPPDSDEPEVCRHHCCLRVLRPLPAGARMGVGMESSGTAVQAPLLPAGCHVRRSRDQCAAEPGEEPGIDETGSRRDGIHGPM
jgi:hypothetical protein